MLPRFSVVVIVTSLHFDAVVLPSTVVDGRLSVFNGSHKDKLYRICPQTASFECYWSSAGFPFHVSPMTMIFFYPPIRLRCRCVTVLVEIVINVRVTFCSHVYGTWVFRSVHYFLIRILHDNGLYLVSLLCLQHLERDGESDNQRKAKTVTISMDTAPVTDIR